MLVCGSGPNVAMSTYLPCEMISTLDNVFIWQQHAWWDRWSRNGRMRGVWYCRWYRYLLKSLLARGQVHIVSYDRRVPSVVAQVSEVIARSGFRREKVFEDLDCMGLTVGSRSCSSGVGHLLYTCWS